MTEWQPIDTAPKDSTWVVVKLANGYVQAAHFAEDLSEEEQPAFSGWFVFRNRSTYYGIPDPVAWKPLDPVENCIHASGGVTCDRCGQLYSDHPLYEGALDPTSGAPFLNIACDGTLLKL